MSQTEPEATDTAVLQQKRRQVQRYWDSHPISTDSVDHERGSRESFEAIYARWKKNGTPDREEFLASCRGRRVLEVGCGIAIDGRFLSENGIDYQAVDLSRQSLKLASEHFRQNDLRRRFTNADATRLPFADGTFGLAYSIGVLHHVPDTPGACREIARVIEPGGDLRVMFYCRDSYHYFLVAYVVRPLIWLLLRLPFGLGGRIARRGPAKLCSMYEISERHGFSKQRLLDISTDTSEAGDDDFNPHSSFYTARELEALFPDFEDLRFWKTDLKYFPLPFFRKAIEDRWGFFLNMTGKKRG
jgi:SAM-dependent methyltransferase